MDECRKSVGKSTVGANMLGYLIDREPCGVLWVMPSREGVADFLKDEIEADVSRFADASARK